MNWRPMTAVCWVSLATVASPAVVSAGVGSCGLCGKPFESLCDWIDHPCPGEIASEQATEAEIAAGGGPLSGDAAEKDLNEVSKGTYEAAKNYPYPFPHDVTKVPVYGVLDMVQWWQVVDVWYNMFSKKLEHVLSLSATLLFGTTQAVPTALDGMETTACDSVDVASGLWHQQQRQQILVADLKESGSWPAASRERGFLPDGSALLDRYEETKLGFLDGNGHAWKSEQEEAAYDALIADMQSGQDILEQKIAGTQQELQAAQADLDKWDARIEDLTGKIADLKDEKANLERQLARLQASTAASDADVQQLKSLISTTEGRIEQAEQQLVAAREQQQRAATISDTLNGINGILGTALQIQTKQKLDVTQALWQRDRENAQGLSSSGRAGARSGRGGGGGKTVRYPTVHRSSGGGYHASSIRDKIGDYRSSHGARTGRRSAGSYRQRPYGTVVSHPGRTQPSRGYRPSGRTGR